MDAWFRLFKKTRFFNERTDGFVPMATVLNEPTFNHRKCIQIVIGTLKCLFGLHARGLTQENMVFEDVFVKKRSVSIFQLFHIQHIFLFIFIDWYRAYGVLQFVFCFFFGNVCQNLCKIMYVCP